MEEPTMEEHAMDGGRRLAGSGPGRRDAARAGRRPGGLAVLVAVAVIGLAACGGGSKSAQGVASLGTSPAGSASGGSSAGSPASSGSGGSSASSGPSGNPTQLLNEFAACMRANGFPDWPTPTIDASKVIDLNLSKGSGGTNPRTAKCQQYLNAASLALRGGKPPGVPSTAALEKFAQCMRANGVPGFPDPSSGGPSSGAAFKFTPGSKVGPNSPAFQHAAKLCGQTGVNAFGSPGSQPGSIVPNAAAAGASG